MCDPAWHYTSINHPHSSIIKTPPQSPKPLTIPLGLYPVISHNYGQNISSIILWSGLCGLGDWGMGGLLWREGVLYGAVYCRGISWFAICLEGIIKSCSRKLCEKVICLWNARLLHIFIWKYPFKSLLIHKVPVPLLAIIFDSFCCPSIQFMAIAINRIEEPLVYWNNFNHFELNRLTCIFSVDLKRLVYSITGA